MIDASLAPRAWRLSITRSIAAFISIFRFDNWSENGIKHPEAEFDGEAFNDSHATAQSIIKAGTKISRPRTTDSTNSRINCPSWTRRIDGGRLKKSRLAIWMPLKFASFIFHSPK